jgi:hypothetical protein
MTVHCGFKGIICDLYVRVAAFAAIELIKKLI